MIITGHGTVENAVQAVQPSASEHLEKPSTPEEISEAMTTVCEKARKTPTEDQSIIHEELVGARGARAPPAIQPSSGTR